MCAGGVEIENATLNASRTKIYCYRVCVCLCVCARARAKIENVKLNEGTQKYSAVDTICHARGVSECMFFLYSASAVRSLLRTALVTISKSFLKLSLLF